MKFLKHSNGWAFEIRAPRGWKELGRIFSWAFGGTGMAVMLWIGVNTRNIVYHFLVPRYEYDADKIIIAKRLEDFQTTTEQTEAQRHKEVIQQVSKINVRLTDFAKEMAVNGEKLSSLQIKTDVLDQRQQIVLQHMANIDGKMGSDVNSNFK